MMIAAVRWSLILLGAGAVITGGLGFRPVEEAGLRADTTPERLVAPRDSIVSIGDLNRLAFRMTPFRASRRRPTVRFGEAPPPPPAPPVPRPTLQLSGILWGAEPVAILEGLPGREGQVVLRQGESDGAFLVQRIGRATVIVTGLDTTWVLKVREPWR